MVQSILGVVALGEHRSLDGRERGEVRRTPHDAYPLSGRTPVRLQEEGALLDRRPQLLEPRGDERLGRRHTGGLEHAEREDPVAQHGGDRIRVEDGGARLVEGGRDAHRDVALVLEHVEVVLHPHPDDIDEALRDPNRLDDRAPIGEDGRDHRHEAAVRRTIWTHQESDAHVIPSALQVLVAARSVCASARSRPRAPLERAGFPLWHVWITAVADWPACLSKSRTRRLLVGDSLRERIGGTQHETNRGARLVARPVARVRRRTATAARCYTTVTDGRVSTAGPRHVDSFLP